MVSIMKSLNAFDKLIEEVSTYKITFAAKACTERLKDATEDLRNFFNENPGDRLAIQHKYNKANTYALQVEYFLCMHDAECNKRYKERENAKALYELARRLLYSYADGEKPKDTREYFVLVDYVGVAQQYLVASENFVIDMTDAMRSKVEEMSKYIVSVARGMDGITVEEYNARSAEACKNEETKDAGTNNNEKNVISRESVGDVEEDNSEVSEEVEPDGSSTQEESEGTVAVDTPKVDGVHPQEPARSVFSDYDL